MRALVASGAPAIQCDEAMIAVPALAAAAGAVGNARRIAAKRGWEEPSVLWSDTIALSGSAKFPALALAVSGALDIEHRYQSEYAVKLEKYKTQLSEWEQTKTGAKLSTPVQQRFVISSATMESIVPILQANPQGLLLVMDELAGWVNGFDAYRAGKGGDLQQWLSIHRAGLLNRDTKGDGNKYAPMAAVSVTGSMQPSIAVRCFKGENVESGLLARMLPAMPPSWNRVWTEATVDPAILEQYAQGFEYLRLLPCQTSSSGALIPRVMPLQPEAKTLYVSFYNELNGARPVGESLNAAWSKLEGYALRIALVIHCLRGATDPAISKHDVDETSMSAGILIARWFMSETRRVYDHFGAVVSKSDAPLAAEAVDGLGGIASVDQLVDKKGLFSKDRRRIQTALDEAVQLGLGKWVTIQTGGRPSTQFKVFTESSNHQKVSTTVSCPLFEDMRI